MTSSTQAQEGSLGWLRDLWERGWLKGLLLVAAVIFLPLLASTPMYLLASQSAQVRENADGAYFNQRRDDGGLEILQKPWQTG